MPEVTVVVDGANVVGSRPDGWWHDRPAAARRLHAALVERCGHVRGLRVVLVLEGAARTGMAAGFDGCVETAHAPGSGDDEVVRQVRSRTGDVLVITADRGLRARVGVAVAGPSWVWDATRSAGSNRQ